MATEKRLIYLDDAKEALTGWETDPTDEEIEYTLDRLPKVDAVPVVRCKDCTNFERKFPGYGYCYHWDYEPGMSPNEVEDNDFCSYGERRTNGTAQI